MGRGEQTADRWSAPPWRLLVTVSGLLAAWALAQVPLPGVDLAALEAEGELLGLGRQNVSVAVLGIAPFISAAILVELVAWLVPRWAPLRHDMEGRARLWRSTVRLGFALAAFQANGVVAMAQSVGLLTGERLTALVSCVAGAGCLFLLAQLITSRGLTNGFVALLLLFGLGPEGQHWWGELQRSLLLYAPGQDGAITAILVAWSALGVVTVAVLTLRVTSRRARPWSSLPRDERPEPVAGRPTDGDGVFDAYKRPRVDGVPGKADASALYEPPHPTSGTAPLGFAALLVGFTGMLAPFGDTFGELDAAVRSATEQAGFAADVVMVGAAAALLGYVFCQPGRIAATWQRAGVGARVAAPGAAEAVLTSVGFCLALLAVGHALTAGRAGHVDVALVAIAAGAVADAVRAYRLPQNHVAVWELHRPYALGVVRAVLHDEGIEAAFRNVAQRRVLSGYGPYVPIEVWVPREHATRAYAALAERLAMWEATGASPAAPATAPMHWRLAAWAAAVAIVALAAGPFVARRLAELEPPPPPPADLRVALLVEDGGPDPMKDAERRVVEGIGLQIENVPIGPGRSVPRLYATAELRDGERLDEPRRRLLAWLDGLQPPQGASWLLGRMYRFDEETGRDTQSGYRTYLVSDTAVLSNQDIVDAVAAPTADRVVRGWVVNAELSEQASVRFEEMTARNVKRRMAIVLEGTVESAPVIQTAIGGGGFQITMGAGSEKDQLADAQRLERALRRMDPDARR